MNVQSAGIFLLSLKEHQRRTKCFIVHVVERDLTGRQIYERHKRTTNREFALAQGHDRKNLAEETGCTEVTISRYIHDQRIPKSDVLAKIADALDTSMDYLETGKRIQEERTMKKEVSRFMVGGAYVDGVYTGPSIPDEIFQRALGTTIKLDMAKQEAAVPTDSGIKTARKGDTIVAYSDFSFDVEPGRINHE